MESLYWKGFESVSAFIGRLSPVAILGETGLRRSEALHLEWSQLDLRKRLAMPERTKNHKSRLVPLSEYAMSWLSTQVRHIKCPYVFVNHRTGERLKWPDKTFRKVAKKAGFPGLGFHDLRCFRATRWARMGVDLKTIQKMLGHADIKTTMKYVKHIDEALDDVRAAQERGVIRETEKTGMISDPLNLLKRLARPAGFEPATYGLEVRCSVQLSYGRIKGFRGIIIPLCVDLCETFSSLTASNASMASLSPSPRLCR